MFFILTFMAIVSTLNAIFMKMPKAHYPACFPSIPAPTVSERSKNKWIVQFLISSKIKKLHRWCYTEQTFFHTVRMHNHFVAILQIQRKLLLDSCIYMTVLPQGFSVGVCYFTTPMLILIISTFLCSSTLCCHLLADSFLNDLFFEIWGYLDNVYCIFRFFLIHCQ